MARLMICTLLLIAGLASSEANRLAGGEVTTIEAYPSVVQIESRVGLVWRQICAANILTSTRILTSALCCSGTLCSRLLHRIRAGTSFRGTDGEVSAVVSVNNHPNFGQAKFEADISVWAIEPLTYSARIRQGVIVASGVTLPVGTPVLKVGWGQTGEGEAAEVLKRASTAIIANDACAKFIEEAGVTVEVSANMICTRDEGNNSVSCAGDGGGPVYYDGIIVGIITSTVGCSNDTLPGINTAVSMYSDWIVNIAS